VFNRDLRIVKSPRTGDGDPLATAVFLIRINGPIRKIVKPDAPDRWLLATPGRPAYHAATQ
jgi:hypothetical protein